MWNDCTAVPVLCSNNIVTLALLQHLRFFTWSDSIPSEATSAERTALLLLPTLEINYDIQTVPLYYSGDQMISTQTHDHIVKYSEGIDNNLKWHCTSTYIYRSLFFLQIIYLFSYSFLQSAGPPYQISAATQHLTWLGRRRSVHPASDIIVMLGVDMRNGNCGPGVTMHF